LLGLPGQARSEHKAHTNAMLMPSSSFSSCSIPNGIGNLAVRDGELRSQITNELQMGQLNFSQATALITMLDEIKRSERTYGKGMGHLNIEQENALGSALENVSHQLQASTNNPGSWLNPNGVGFNQPNLGYPKGMSLPCENARQISSARPWWTF
jgi:hypothetical protein